MGDWWRKRGASYKKKRYSYENVNDACGHRHTIGKVTHFQIKLH